MTNDHTDEIREIIEKQTSSNYKAVSYSVLPPIGSASSVKAPVLKPTTPPTPKNIPDLDRISLLAIRRTTPLIKSQPIPIINLADLPENELISHRSLLLSTRRNSNDDNTEIDEDRLVEEEEQRKKSIISGIAFKLSVSGNSSSVDAVEDSLGFETVSSKLAKIPSQLPSIEGLHNACESLSENRINNILNACRLYDHENRGYLNSPTILKCFGEVIPSSHSTSSPYRTLMNYLSPEGELIDYAKLLKLFQSHIQEDFKNNRDPILPELLQTNPNWRLLPSAAQEARERGRRQVMLEIEVLIMRHPELDIERIKMATTQTEIETTEMQMILELYSIREHFDPFLQRLFSCFLTENNKFHFSAFVGCLENIKPITIKNRISTPKAPWLEPPLEGIQKK